MIITLNSKSESLNTKRLLLPGGRFCFCRKASCGGNWYFGHSILFRISDFHLWCPIGSASNFVKKAAFSLLCGAVVLLSGTNQIRLYSSKISCSGSSPLSYSPTSGIGCSFSLTTPFSSILAYSTEYLAQGWASRRALGIGSPVPSQIP